MAKYQGFEIKKNDLLTALSVLLVLSFYSEVEAKKQKEFKLMTQKSESKIGQEKFLAAYLSDKYFLSDIDGHQRKKVVQTNSDMTKMDRQRSRIEFKLRYVKEGKNENFGFDIDVIDESANVASRNQEFSAYPLNSDAKYEADLSNSSAQHRTYREADYFVKETLMSVKSKPNMVVFYLINGIEVRVISYQYKPDTLVNLIKKTEFLRLGDL